MNSLSNVEIFRTGVWHGRRYAAEDLEVLAVHFAALAPVWRPPLKLGHGEDQRLPELLGLPGVGEVARVWRDDDRLLADFVNIPDAVFRALVERRYRVSAEIHPRLRVTVPGEAAPRVLRLVLRAVALVLVPAIKDLRVWAGLHFGDLSPQPPSPTSGEGGMNSVGEPVVPLHFRERVPAAQRRAGEGNEDLSSLDSPLSVRRRGDGGEVGVGDCAELQPLPQPLPMNGEGSEEQAGTPAVTGKSKGDGVMGTKVRQFFGLLRELVGLPGAEAYDEGPALLAAETAEQPAAMTDEVAPEDDAAITARIAAWTAEGLLRPAAAPPALALLRSQTAQPVQFAEGDAAVSVADAFEQVLRANGPVVDYSEKGRALEFPAGELSAQHAERYAKRVMGE